MDVPPPKDEPLTAQPAALGEPDTGQHPELREPEVAEPLAPARPLAPWWRRWLLMLILVLVSVGLDQWTKHWAHTSLRRDHGGRVELVEGYLSMTYVRNPGAAWGFLSRRPASFRRPFFTGVSIVAIIFILYLYVRLEPGQRLLMTALSLVMGGALGNFIDRLRFNYVIDFIDCYWGRSFKWPTFNIADIAITVGVLILFLDMIVVTVRQRRAARAATPPPDSQP